MRSSIRAAISSLRTSVGRWYDARMVLAASNQVISAPGTSRCSIGRTVVIPARSSARFGGRHLDHEPQRLVRRDHGRVALRAVGLIGRDAEEPLAADLHARDAVLPALDHLVQGK